MTEAIRNRFMNDPTLYPPDLPLERDPRFLCDVKEGTIFATREECKNAGVHIPQVAGIHGDMNIGAFSICMSGGYEDDEDHGFTFTYTGAGGRESDDGSGYGAHVAQTKDQSLSHPSNAALCRSSITRIPVRVVRGSQLKSAYAPLHGFRYDGLYIVERAYMDKGKSGFMVCKFDFKKVSSGAGIR